MVKRKNKAMMSSVSDKGCTQINIEALMRNSTSESIEEYTSLPKFVIVTFAKVDCAARSLKRSGGRDQISIVEFHWRFHYEKNWPINIDTMINPR